MSDLVEFLLARIAEDEAVARAFDGIPSRAYETDGLAASAEYVTVYASPARVLAECEAKRRVVERCAALADIQVRRQTRELAGDTLRALALPYADHSDYDEAWRP